MVHVKLGRRVRAAASLVGVVTLVAACGSSLPRASLRPTATSSVPSSSRSSSSATTPPSSSGTAPPAATIRWTSCNGTDGPTGYQCATLPVPLDYSDPAKGTIGIALDRHPASGAHPIGSLLINPGGPGESGVTFLPEMMSALPSDITQDFNIVGFDPRGVGRSDPIICGTSAQLAQFYAFDPVPAGTAGFDAMVAADRSFAAGCEARSGRILPYVSTANTARDMDRIRAAVGDAKLNYLGFSYGTFLGATYARLFPTHIRAMVLDGSLDPALPAIPMLATQSTALYGEFKSFLASCAPTSSSAGCGWNATGNLVSDYDHLLAQITAHPVPVSGSGQSVNQAVLLYGTAAALYNPENWSFLGSALTQLQQGSGSEILELFNDYVGRNSNGSFQNVDEAETAIDCLDSPAPSLAQIRAAAPAVNREASFFGLLDLYSEAGCTVWPIKATGQVGPIHADGSPTIVVVGSTHDPVTPYAWAQALAGQLQHGVLLTRDGYGHTGYLFSSCIRSNVDTYLITLKPPAAGTVCPSNS